MNMRLGFHYHIPAEQRPDGIYTPGYLGRFIDSLAVHCEQVVCFQHAPRPSQQKLLDYRLQSKNIQLVGLGQHCSVPRRTLLARRYARALEPWRDQLDVMLCRAPSPLTPAFAAKARALGIPSALLIVGSNIEGIDDLPQPQWRKELIRIVNHYNQWRQNRIARQCLTFVNSRKFYDEYQRFAPFLHETRTTTLNSSDFYERSDTCLKKPVRLLYVGRYDRSKGLLDIIEVLGKLVSDGHDLVLDLVGWDDSGTGVEVEMSACADRYGVTNRVFNHGRKAVGPELFDYYQRADIFVNASKTTEGFPRTIWEAMAHSLPVVATSVGSIPHFVSHVAKIVQPNDVEALAGAIKEIIAEPQKRQRMIAAGLNLARNNTLEIRSRELISVIDEHLKKCKYGEA